MTVALFLLRCTQLGLSMSDLDYVTMGMVFDMLAESGNDSVKYDVVASQEDFDRF